MNKTVLAILFGALLSSSWWGAVIYANSNHPLLYLLSITLSIFGIIWIAHESEIIINCS